MAHRRALARGRGWMLWLLAPLALALDGLTALGLAGHRAALGLAIPEAFLLAAPFLVYGGLVFAVFRARPLSVRLAATAVLLGVHAALVVIHTIAFASLWSLPMPAALRLAHRWSPLIPLLQLIWVPLLALPLARLAQGTAPVPARRSGPSPTRRDVLAARGAPAGQRRAIGADRDLGGEADARAVLSLAVTEVMPAASPEPARREPGPPAPVPTPAEPVAEVSPVIAPQPPAIPAPERAVTAPPPIAAVHDLAEVTIVSATVAPPVELPIDPEPTAADAVASAPTVEPAAVFDDAAPLASIDTVVVLSGSAPIPQAPPVPPVVPPTDAGPVVAEPAPPTSPPPAPSLVPAEPPLDLYIVARLFEPYGPLLAREGAVVVDWTAGPRMTVVCVAPRGVSRDRMVQLGSRLARALAETDDPATSARVRRLTLHGPDGVAVLTPLEGGMLVAAASRPGAAALLEVLSTRVVPGPLGGDPAAGRSSAAPVTREIGVSEAVRVETPAARVDVLAPADVAAPPLGELAGRLLAALGEEGGDGAVRILGVDLGSHRLIVHPVPGHGRPPRFVALVGGPELPGLLGRRAERAARTFREVS